MQVSYSDYLARISHEPYAVPRDISAMLFFTTAYNTIRVENMKFLVGFNGTKAAQAALALARDHAEIFEAKILVITSMGGGAREKPEKIGEAAKNLVVAGKFLQEKGITCETHQLARGLSPGEDLVQFAEENDIDQIFVGVEKMSRTQKIIVGSNAQYIILKAPCPVVTVKNWSK